MPVRIDIAVIGGGPAGIAAATAAASDGASVLLIEREMRLGGILKQCIHDGFGIIRYDEKLAGPEYAHRDILELNQTKARVLLQTFVTRIEKSVNGFQLSLSNRFGIVQIEAGCVILATGCRERTAKQVAIHGTRPAGVFTAGTAQYYTNIMGQLPAKRCVILGSGDIGLIMARRLKLEGADVLGVYEINHSPGGLLRNVSQCLDDFDIPLYLNHTVTRVFGTQRLRAVEIYRTDKNMLPVRGTETVVECDALILSVGLIPENEIAESLGVEISRSTQGPVCDQNHMTMVEGVFSCGNAMHVSDLVDYVSESGRTAGISAARYMRGSRTLVNIEAGKDFMYAVPQCLDIEMIRGETVIYFRSGRERVNATVKLTADGNELFSKHYNRLRPPEMERISVDFGEVLTAGSKISLRMEADK